MITAERLRDVLDYDPETGVFRWGNGAYVRIGIGKVAGWVQGNGYRYIQLFGQRYLAHRLAWLYVHGEWPMHEVDHINGVPADNRICNLRAATRTENCQNRKMRSDNSSGLKGVYWDESHKKWRAQIHSGGKKVSLGSFACKNEAHAAYVVAARRFFGEFARVA